MGGLLIAGRDALAFLLAAALLLSLGGAFLASWPVLLAVLTDGRTYLAIGVTIFALALAWMRRQERQHDAPPMSSVTTSTLSAYCNQCGSARPDLICPMCGAIALEKIT